MNNGKPETKNEEKILKVENLKVHFPIRKGLLSRPVGYVYAVDGVSFDLKKGETLGIVGESGCGKTTAGMAVMNLNPPTDGDVWWKGKKMADMTPSQMRALRRDMQLIFQDPYSSLNPRMTVNQILADPMEVHGMYKGEKRKERIDYLMETVGLSPEQGTRYPHEFSGGQRQRIGIARSLALSPSLIIGDEPVSALDVSIQAQIINLLMNLKSEFDLSMIIISHDLAVVEYLCDRIIVMYLGKIIESASYASLYNDAKHPYTQALLSAVPVPDPLREKNRIILQGDVPSPIDPPSGCRFHTRCPRKMEICEKNEPAMKEFDKGHTAACHLY
ncbi:oligopeptide transporter subunit; ATP-binding component of ABC superfamily [Desulfamplus magnetovallimortis]|uniref:Oligopeptide transporter subunit ATP-binding component of ABC superfamily n=1 Tax=Desulfamplus magnetovallimortis TaxID=1246637 RepID=A0A1W1HJ12_9BACT|nr:dipeptide ABC transporter ATP-binding protein [Desulfamplus magnetovallimortis]SLM32358.1 oligopeptide transporter subunit; ATP-binding component of ABC superfamily [Desulfamplus magnetovallimortis]